MNPNPDSKRPQQCTSTAIKITSDDVIQTRSSGGDLFNVFMCFIVPALLPYFLWGEPLLNGFLIAGCLRVVCVYHFTWCVNSVAHFWGDRPYDPKSNPTENAFVSCVAIGEGWHNWHHKYPFDYAASELGISSQFNPSKLFIDAFAKIGLVTGRRRALNMWHKSDHRRQSIQSKQAQEITSMGQSE